MSGINDRGNAFESKFANDEALDFRVEARMCKLYGMWAAEQLGLEGPEADIYAKEVIAANLEEPGFMDVYRKVRADFDEQHLKISDHIMEKELEICMIEAKKQVLEG